MSFKIVAKQGDDRLLLTADNKTAFVADTSYKLRYPEFNLQSILARGYWEVIENDEELAEKVLKFPLER